MRTIVTRDIAQRRTGMESSSKQILHISAHNVNLQKRTAQHNGRHPIKLATTDRQKKKIENSNDAFGRIRHVTNASETKPRVRNQPSHSWYIYERTPTYPHLFSDLVEHAHLDDFLVVVAGLATLHIRLRPLPWSPLGVPTCSGGRYSAVMAEDP